MAELLRDHAPGPPRIEGGGPGEVERDSAADSPRVRLTGWGRTAPSVARLRTPGDDRELAGLLGAADARRCGIIARGLGRSYGDAAQCAGGTVVTLSSFDQIGPIDPQSGLVEVGAGVSLDQLIRHSLPLGWFIPVSPGTRQVTIGGAIAADIHGKNHHRDGSFCGHVRELTLLGPTGTQRVTPERDPELFWATGGGMGLTGMITAATIAMIRVETSSIIVDEQRFGDLDAVMSAMESGDDRYHYSVAWVDCASRGRGRGRAVLTRGEHAALAALGGRAKGAGASIGRPARLRVPVQAPRSLVNSLSVAAFNELWFHKSKDGSGMLRSASNFFHPLDGIAGWNLLYGPRGFVQYQFVVDDAHADAVRRAVEMFAGSGVPSFLGVLKRFGPGNPGPLSFPMPGWTLAVDLPVGPPRLPGLLDQLDDLVVAAGGRVYLAKDSRLRPELLAAMYPRLGELAAIRSLVDPDHVLRSDLSRRLGLDAR